LVHTGEYFAHPLSGGIVPLTSVPALARPKENQWHRFHRPGSKRLLKASYLLAMKYSIRKATVADLEDVLALNQSEVPHVGSITMAEMSDFLTMASYFHVVRDDHGDLLASLIGLGPSAAYASLNYRWFDERYPRFAYIDRIAVAANARRQGIAEALYKDFEHQSGKQTEWLCCEVNLVPENPVSMAFHQRLGFKQVGTLETANGAKKVALLIRAC